jgi:hypothetical protein
MELILNTQESDPSADIRPIAARVPAPPAL